MRKNWMHVLWRADQRLKRNHKDVLLPAHPQKLYLLVKELGPIWTSRIITHRLLCRRNWSIFFVMGVYFEKTMERLNSGEEKIIFGTNLRILDIGPMKSRRASWQEEEEKRKDFNIVLTRQEQSLRPSSSRSFRTQFYWSFIGCAINLHSIIKSGLIPGGQNLSQRQKVFFLLVNPADKEHKDPEIDLKASRLARYLQTEWKKHQNTVYRVAIKLAQKKGLKFYQTRSNAIILYNTLPAYCIPKAVQMDTGEIIFEKVCASPRPPKISFKDNWMKQSGSDVAGVVKAPNKPNQRPHIQFIERRDPLWQNKHPVRVLRKSIRVSLLTARIPICLLNVRRKTKT